MSRLMTFLVPLFTLGVAQAQEVHDAPIPDPNYFGIIIFLLLFVGGSVWFVWNIFRKDKRDKQDKHDKHSHA